MNADDANSGQGGVIKMANADMLKIENSLIQDTWAETSTILYSTAQTVDISLRSSTFICDNGFSADESAGPDYLG